MEDSQQESNGKPAGISRLTNTTSSVNKILKDKADSLHVSGRSILPKNVILDSVLTGSTIDLGTTIVDSAFNVDGKVISTIRYDKPDNQNGLM